MAEKIQVEEKEEKKTSQKNSDKDDEKKDYSPKQKPKLEDSVKRSQRIKKTQKAKKPDFKRQEWFRYKKLGESWRKPRGMHSAMRKHYKYRINVASIGYGAPKDAKDLHPSGFQEVLVHRPADLDGIDPKVQAARIGHAVGDKKRIDIEERADKLGIRILNRRE